jgi:hypothetical protein
MSRCKSPLGARTIEAAAAAADTGLATVQTVLPRLVSAGLVEQRDGLHVSLEASGRQRAIVRRADAIYRTRRLISGASSATSSRTVASGACPRDAVSGA